jgi:glucose-1-phosphate thymidylyltransferase
MKGLILLGGLGSRLAPTTVSVNKHLLPLFDKPIYYYPLSTLMLMGIQEIGIVSTPETLALVKKNLGDGSRLGCEFNYIVQRIPKGIPNGVSNAKNFLKDSNFALILGDNFFYGVGLGHSLRNSEFVGGAKIYGHVVSNPSDYGVIEIKNKKILRIIEKPSKPLSNIAITGLYHFDSQALDYIKELKPNVLRKEFDIVDLLNIYKKRNTLGFELLPRGTVWLDTGTSKSLLEASNFVKVIEERQDLKIGCIEEIALRNKWIGSAEIAGYIKNSSQNEYYDYLKKLID